MNQYLDLFLLRPWRALGRSSRLAERNVLRGLSARSLFGQLAARISKAARRNQLVSLVDLFGLATGAAGKPQYRDGVDIFGALERNAPTRAAVLSFHGVPGTPQFNNHGPIGQMEVYYLANGGREQLFDLESDPHEFRNVAAVQSSVAAQLRARAFTSI